MFLESFFRNRIIILNCKLYFIHGNTHCKMFNFSLLSFFIKYHQKIPPNIWKPIFNLYKSSVFAQHRGLVNLTVVFTKTNSFFTLLKIVQKRYAFRPNLPAGARSAQDPSNFRSSAITASTPLLISWTASISVRPNRLLLEMSNTPPLLSVCSP